MLDPGLHENGHTCPACELRREEANREISGKADVPCNNCGGTGRVAASIHEVIHRSTSWAIEHYWPERERAFAHHNKKAKLTP